MIFSVLCYVQKILKIACYVLNNTLIFSKFLEKKVLDE